MKILHLTDIHGSAHRLSEIISQNDFDILVLSGDLTHFGGTTEIRNLFYNLNTKELNILCVTGNCDYPECKEFLEEKGLLLENRIKIINGYQFIGLGGSLKCPGKTPNEFTDVYYEKILNGMEEELNSELPIILVSHQPPYKTRNDKVFLGFHVGSKAIRQFIEYKQPKICLTGHIHEGKGHDFIGKTPVINPGPAKDGHFAIIDFIGELLPEISLY